MSKVINIVGYSSNVGKTLLIENLIKELKSRGYSIATIKHDVHGFDIDKKGKDTYKHREAGAETVVISSKNRFAMIKELNEEIEFNDIIKLLLDKDIILVEGYKNSNLRKIEVYRSGVSDKIITPKEKIIAVASDINLNLENIKVIDKNSIKELADLIEKENEFKKSLDVVAQKEEPDEVSKEFANKLGVDEKNIVSTGNTIKSTYYSFTVLSWTKGKEYPGYALPESKNLADYPGAVLDEQGNITNDFSYVVVNLSVKNQSSKTIENDLIWGYIRLRFLSAPSKYSDYIGEVTYLGEEKPRILNHNYYAETFAPEEEKVMPMIFVVNDALLDSEAMYLEINPTGAVIDNPDYDIRRYIVLN